MRVAAEDLSRSRAVSFAVSISVGLTLHQIAIVDLGANLKDQRGNHAVQHFCTRGQSGAGSGAPSEPMVRATDVSQSMVDVVNHGVVPNRGVTEFWVIAHEKGNLKFDNPNRNPDFRCLSHVMIRSYVTRSTLFETCI